MEFFVMLVLIGFALVAIGFGIVLTVLALLFVFGMVSFGVLSTSIIVGLHKKSVAEGFKIFVVLGASVFGLLGGSLVFWLVNEINKWCSATEAVIWGSSTGLIAGFGFGVLAFYILKRLTIIFKEKLKLE